MIKKSLLFLILLCYSHLFYGQSFSLNELNQLVKMNIDDFDTFVTSKGYTFSEKEKEDNHESFTYKSTQKGVKGNYIEMSIYYPTNEKFISFETRNSQHYLNIKSQLKARGFKFIKTEEGNNGAVILYYQKGDIKVNLASGQDGDISKGKYTYYEISVIMSNND